MKSLERQMLVSGLMLHNGKNKNMEKKKKGKIKQSFNTHRLMILIRLHAQSKDVGVKKFPLILIETKLGSLSQCKTCISISD